MRSPLSSITQSIIIYFHVIELTIDFCLVPSSILSPESHPAQQSGKHDSGHVPHPQL